jgi:molybdopterin-binding protein
VTQLRVSQAAELLSVSDDTVRRWVEAGRLVAGPEEGGRATVEASSVAALMRELSPAVPVGPIVAQSARNRFSGIVTRVVRDTVMAQVEIQSGPHRFVSLMSREAADELGLEPGVPAIASIKSTNVVIEIVEK